MTRVARPLVRTYDRRVTDHARKVLQDAMALSIEERTSLVDKLVETLPVDDSAVAEIERRARRAISDPAGGEAWDVVARRINDRRPR
jgi:hypothetical protein